MKLESSTRIFTSVSKNMSSYLVTSNDAKPISYFTERGLSDKKATEMSDLVCNAVKRKKSMNVEGIMLNPILVAEYSAGYQN